jgi:hypothetical protein
VSAATPNADAAWQYLTGGRELEEGDERKLLAYLAANPPPPSSDPTRLLVWVEGAPSLANAPWMQERIQEIGRTAAAIIRVEAETARMDVRRRRRYLPAMRRTALRVCLCLLPLPGYEGLVPPMVVVAAGRRLDVADLPRALFVERDAARRINARWLFLYPTRRGRPLRAALRVQVYEPVRCSFWLRLDSRRHAGLLTALATEKRLMIATADPRLNPMAPIFDVNTRTDALALALRCRPPE